METPLTDPVRSSPDRGDLQRIIGNLDREIAQDPKNAVAYNRQGIAYLSLREYQRAIADYSQAIALDANFAASYFNRGQAAEGTDTFLGITRDLLRGGKPEMFFATCLNITKAQVEQKFKKARDRWENKELRWLEFTNPLTPLVTEQERATFLQEFLSLLSLYQDQFSRPAQVNFTLWFKYIWFA